MKSLLKLCGNKSLQDLKVSLESSARYIGFIFADSGRKVDSLQLADWLHQVEVPEGKQLVGVFVNPSLSELAAVMKHVDLDIIQCHGSETPEYVGVIKQIFSKPVWKVIHHAREGFERMKVFEGVADGYVIDSKVEGRWGGTGVRFDWSAIPTYVDEANRQQKPCFIAGGITPDNIRECLEYDPPGIDLSSGIERNNRKDEELVRQLEERMEYHDSHLSR